MSEEAQVLSKVEQLMKTLDQVKRYRALARLIADFSAIMLLSFVLLFLWEIAFNLYRMETGFPCFYSTPVTFTCTNFTNVGVSPILQLFAGLAGLLVPTAGLLTGIFWVDRGLKLVRGEDWREPLKEGFPGAVKLLQELKWDSIFEDIRVSKIGYAVYFAVKVTGYWFLAFVVLTFPYGIGLSILHVDVNLGILAFLSLALVIVLSRSDLQRRFQQVASLDSLMWELRWFSSGFGSAKFEA